MPRALNVEIGERVGRRVVVAGPFNKMCPSGSCRFVTCKCDCGSVADVLVAAFKNGRVPSCPCVRSKPLDEKYGKWTVLAAVPRGKVRVRCECGNEKVISTKTLRDGTSTSCGCWKHPVKVGQRFGMLTVIEVLERHGTGHRCLCRCDCGNEKVIHERGLKGKTKSCGCAHDRLQSEAHREHGMTGSPEWNSWSSMIARCYNPKATRFDCWGGRGITVTDRWRGEHGFVNFYADMGPRPKGCTLDRIDCDGNYEPGNCRWATHQEQLTNRHSTRFIEHDGKRLSLAEWSRVSGISGGTIAHRLRYGWDVAKALTQPPARW
jgi:hypothetical protein